MGLKKALDIKYFRITTKTDTLEKWIHNITSASLEHPLLTTLITMTAGVILLLVMLILVVLFAGVICLTSVILLMEGLLLVMITAAVSLLMIICAYIYVVCISLSVYFKTSTKATD